MSRRYPVQKDERGHEAERLVQALRKACWPFGPDGIQDDDWPAIQHRNAGLTMREEIALNRENGRPYGLNMAAEVIRSRVQGDPSAGRDQYLRRH